MWPFPGPGAWGAMGGLGAGGTYRYLFDLDFDLVAPHHFSSPLARLNTCYGFRLGWYVLNLLEVEGFDVIVEYVCASVHV
jgi:hypothetical protein